MRERNRTAELNGHEWMDLDQNADSATNSQGPLGKLLNLSELQLPHLHNEETDLTELGLRELESDCASSRNTGRREVVLYRVQERDLTTYGRKTAVSGHLQFLFLKTKSEGFPGGAVVKNPPVNAGDTGSSPGQEDSTCHRATKPMHHNY